MKVTGNRKKLENIRYFRELKNNPERYKKYLEGKRKYNKCHNKECHLIRNKTSYNNLMEKEAILNYENSIQVYIDMLDIQIKWRIEYEKENIL